MQSALFATSAIGTRLRDVLRLLIVTFVMLVSLVQAADATTVDLRFLRTDVNGRGVPDTAVYQVTVVDSDGVDDRLQAETSAQQVVVHDDGVALTAGDACRAQEPGVVVCTPPMPASGGQGYVGFEFVVRTGAGDDDVQMTKLQADVNAGAGHDRVAVAYGTVLGGPGDDTLTIGSAGLVDGGPGADKMDATAGRVSRYSAATVSYRSHTDGVTVTQDDRANDGAPGEGDNVGPGFTRTIGGSGPDLLIAGMRSGLYGAAGDDVLLGSGEADHLEGGHGNDVLRGNDANDTLIGGPGSDLLRGDAGFDEVSYEHKMRGVDVTLDDIADDGTTGERDNVGSDVEKLIGGFGPDVLRGGPGAQRLVGGNGADRLYGGPGDDVFFTDDRTTARRRAEAVDRIVGGPGHDRAYVDGLDRLDLADGERDLVRCSRGSSSLMHADRLDRARYCAPELAIWGRRPRVLRADDRIVVHVHCPAGGVGCRGRMWLTTAWDHRAFTSLRIELQPATTQRLTLPTTARMRTALSHSNDNTLFAVARVYRAAPRSSVLRSATLIPSRHGR